MEPGMQTRHVDPEGAARRARTVRLEADARMLHDLIENGFEVDGEAVLCERMTWVIYGRTTYDGELILAEYQNPEDAARVIRSVGGQGSSATSRSTSDGSAR